MLVVTLHYNYKHYITRFNIIITLAGCIQGVSNNSILYMYTYYVMYYIIGGGKLKLFTLVNHLSIQYKLSTGNSLSSAPLSGSP